VIRGLVRLSVLTGVACAVVCQPANLPKPRITLDEFFDATGIDDVHISPDGNSVLIDTERPDWAGNRYLHEIWLWREGAAPGATPAGAPFQLTQSGYDHGAQWSPDGRWIAFLSDRPKEGEAEDADKEKGLPRVWVIPADGGEAFPVTGGEEGVHSFAWSADSRAIYYAARLAWTKEQENAYRKEWNDVNRFRESERGDVIHEVAVRPSRDGKPEERQVAVLQYRASQLASSPDGKMLAFAGISASERAESAEPWRLSTIDLPSGTPRVLSHSNAIYEKLQWAPDSRRILFQVISGSLDGSYRDVQPRLYSADAGSGQVTRWGVAFSGAVSGYSVTRDGGAIVAGMLGTQTRLYATSAPEGSFAALQSWEGTSSLVSAAAKADRFAFVFSSLGKPPEVYLAANREALNRARPITTFSSLFTGRALPEGKPYRWKADDGTTVEGMLLYPPGEFGGKHLRMFTLIHGGPADADGDKFGADWYDWATLALCPRNLSSYRLPARERHPCGRGRPGKRWDRRSGSFDCGRIQRRWLSNKLADYPDYPLQGRGNRRGRRGARCRLGQRRCVHGRRVLPWRLSLGSPGQLQCGSGYLADYKGENSHASGGGGGGHPGAFSGVLFVGAGAARSRCALHAAGFSRRRPFAQKQSVVRQNQGFKRYSSWTGMIDR
jgi:Tol biopolymer transport system component